MADIAKALLIHKAGKAHVIAAVLCIVLCGVPTAVVAARLAPLGAQIYCLKHPVDCSGGHVAYLHLTAGSQAMLARVNREVNARIRPEADTHGDKWSVDVRAGDCEDYALTKRAWLIRAGVPAGALGIAVGTLPNGQGHALLVVRTDHGMLALSNLTDTMRPLNSVRGRWTAISGRNLGEWHAL